MQHYKKIFLVAGPLAALVVGWLPLPALTTEAHRLAAIMTVVILYWMTEPIPLYLTGLIGMALATVVGISSPWTTAASFVDPIIILFIGTFMLARAMQLHQLDQRIAYSLLSHRWVGGHPLKTLWAFGLAAWLMAMWMSITACVAMLYPVALAIAKHEKDRRHTAGRLLLLTYAASAGALATPVGTPPNLIGIGYIRDFLGISIGFLQWMIVGLPLAFVLFTLRYSFVAWRFGFAAPAPPERHAEMRTLYKNLGKMTKGERNTLIVFGMAVVSWMIPGMPPSWVAMGAGILLLLWPLHSSFGKFTLPWRNALQIDWKIILLFASGMALGKMMLDTKLAEVMGTHMLGWAGTDPWLLTLIAILVTVIVSELASNIAAANIVIPVMLAFFSQDRTMAYTVALGTTFAASMGFMLPVSTPSNAIIYSSGSIKMREMVRTGFWIDVIGVIVVMVLVMRIVPVLGIP